MFLADHQIIQMCEQYEMIRPWDISHVQPASYDLTLSDSFRVYDFWGRNAFARPLPIIPWKLDPELTTEISIRKIGRRYIEPNEFILGSTQETVKIPHGIVARVEGKSSLGRLGILVHSTAGFIDPGFEGTITLELYNLNRAPILLRPGMKIAQLSFSQMAAIPDRPYGHKDLESKYQGQTSATESRYAC